MYFNGAVCSHGDILGSESNTFSTFKIKHILSSGELILKNLKLMVRQEQLQVLKVVLIF